MGTALNINKLDRMTAGTEFTAPPKPATAPQAAVSAPVAASAHLSAEAPVTASQAAATPAEPAPAPAPSAFDGAAVITREADVYATGEHSFVRDAFHARVDGDTDAAERLTRWRAQQAEFVALRPGFGEIIPPGYRPELMVETIDKGRPIMSRLTNRINITDATPFKIPVEGEFTGVGDHVEGTAHVAAGTLTVGELTVSPKAISGAWEVSRELVDAANPAIDRLATNAMLRDYRRHTEEYAAAQLVAGLTPVVAADGAALEAQLIEFLDDRDASPAFVAAAVDYYTAIATEQAGDGRARYPYLNPTNAAGSTTAGFAGLNVQGVPLVRAGAIDATQAALVYPDDVLVGESPLLQFRFDEVQGPGVIKLALWSYVVVQRVRDAGVRVVTSTAGGA